MESIITKLSTLNKKTGNQLYIMLYDDGAGDLIYYKNDVVYDSFESVADLHDMLDDVINDIESSVIAVELSL